MAYPVITDANSRKLWREWSDGGSEEQLLAGLEVNTATDGGDHDWPEVVAVMIAELEEIYGRVDAKQLSNDRFEAMACAIIHQALPMDDALADPEFWIWIATVPGRNLIRRRYLPTDRYPIPDLKNYTSSNARETLFYRLWIRAEMAFDPESRDAYQLASYGDIDFWRSHVFRQTSTETGALLKALIEFQHPNGPKGEKRLSQGDIRQLIKLMKRASANVLVEALDDKSAKKYVETQWQKMQQTAQ